MRIEIHHRHYFHADNKLMELLRLIAANQLKIERKITTMSDEIMERLQEADRKQDEQAERLRALFSDLSSNITQLKQEIAYLREEERRRLEPFVAALEQNVENFASIGVSEPVDTPTDAPTDELPSDETTEDEIPI